MEIKLIKVYSLWHTEKQCQLTLTLGYVDGINGKNTLHWKLKGKYIPFPVHSNTWFVGFSSEIMLSYLNDCGYELEAVVNMKTGDIRVFPCRVKADELNINVVVPSVDDASPTLKKYVCRVARCVDKVTATALVKYFYGIGLRDANNTVNQWLDECK
jgi:hypothetical protein